MATKTITITEKAYSLLAAEKSDKESFSDIITHHFAKHSFSDLAGILTHKEAEELRSHIKASRAASRKRLDRIAKRLA